MVAEYLLYTFNKYAQFKICIPAAFWWSEECLLERLPVLGGDDVVDDGVDGGVEVEEDPGDVHQVLVGHVVGLLGDKVEPGNKMKS